MNTQTHRRSGQILAAIAGAVVAGMLASGASAQHRVGTDGHARDASNRVGSGGLNTPIPQPLINGNNIVTGNVTGGREFRGFVPYTDPTAFRGQTAGTNVDSFTRGSAGVPIGIFNNNNAQNVTTFYGDARGVAAPAGFAQQAPGQSGYVPAPVVTRTRGDLRLGNPFSDVFSVEQPRPGQLMMPGPVDPSTNQPTVISASPLYGVRSWRLGDAGDEQFLSSYTDNFTAQRRTSRLDTSTVDQMRGELQSQMVDPSTPTGSQPLSPLGADATGTGQDTTVTPGTVNSPNLNRPFDQPADPSLQNKPLDSSSSSEALQGGLATNQGVSQKLLTNKPISVSKNSPAYRELQERFDKYKEHSEIADAQRNREFNAERRAREQAAKGGQPGQPGQPAGQPGPQPGGLPGTAAGPGTPTPGGPGSTPPPGPVAGGPGGTGTPPGLAPLPGTGPLPGTTGVPTIPGGTGAGPGAAPTTPDGKPQPDPLPGVGPADLQPADPNRPRPVQISSLTKDMKSSAVTDLMKEAEQLMKAGKYTSALDKYDMVEQVTPNDPLVALGRATAELGASYYQRADSHLREAFTKNPALLMGQYDLRAFLGEDRLQYLVKDLKDVARADAKQPRPVLLLAYIAYNTGNERRAAAYLDLAEKRSGGNDPFFKLLRGHWSLPAADGGAEELNK